MKPTLLSLLLLPFPQESHSGAAALERALAEWELAAATLAAEPAAMRRIQELDGEAASLAAAHPSDTALAASAAAIAAAHGAFLAAHGQSTAAPEAAAAVGQGAPRDEAEVIAQLVFSALGANTDESRQSIRALGKRAVPTLVGQARLLQPNAIQGNGLVALRLLVEADPERFFEVAHGLAAGPSVLVRQALCQILTREGLSLFTSPQYWEPAAELGWRPRQSVLAELLERLYAEPRLNPAHLAELALPLANLGWLPKGLLEAAPEFPRSFWDQLGAETPGAAPLYAQGLAADVPARKDLAGRIARLRDATALLRWVDDPSADVRRAVAWSLGCPRVIREVGNLGMSAQNGSVCDPLTPERAAALYALLADDSPVVVAPALGAAISHWRSRHTGAAFDLTGLLQAIKALAGEEQRMQFWRETLVRHDPSGRATIDRLILEQVFSEPSSGAIDLLTSVWGLELSDAERARIFARIGADHLGWAMDEKRRPAPAQPDDVRQWSAILHNTDLSACARLAAAPWAITRESVTDTEYPALVAAITRAYVEQPWRSDPALTKHMHFIGARLEAVGRPYSDLYLALLAEPKVDAALALALPFPAEIAAPSVIAEWIAALFERVPPTDSEWQSRGERMQQVVAATRTLPLEAALPVLRAARGIATTAMLEEIRERRDPALLGLLRESLEAGGTSLTLLANTAAAFLSEDAGKLILDIAARATVGETRGQVLEALTQVSTYLDARARWEQRQDAGLVRARAIAELVAICSDEGSHSLEQRAEALRGLGLLGAVEELPRLVRFLSDPRPELVAAARAALARLQGQ